MLPRARAPREATGHTFSRSGMHGSRTFAKSSQNQAPWPNLHHGARYDASSRTRVYCGGRHRGRKGGRQGGMPEDSLTPRSPSTPPSVKFAASRYSLQA